MNRLSTIAHHGRQAIQEARPAWDELLGLKQDPIIFSRPVWAEAAQAVYGELHEAVVLEFRDGKAPVGLLPLQLTTFPGIGTRRLEFLTGGPPTLTRWLVNPDHLGQALYNDILTAPGYERSVLTALRDWLEAESRHWDTLRLTCVPVEGVLAKWFDELARGWSAHVAFDEKAFLDTSGGWEAYKTRLSKRQQRHLRYEPNALERAVGARAALVADRGRDAADAVEIFVKLHRERWNAREKLGLLASEAERYRRLALSPEAGVVVYRLMAGRQAVAVQFGFDDGRRYIPYALAFDPTLERTSPAQVLMYYVIRSCCEDDHTEVDLATLDAVDQWAGQPRARVHMTACSPELAARVRNRMLETTAHGLSGLLRTKIGRYLQGRAGNIRYRWTLGRGQRVEPTRLRSND